MAGILGDLPPGLRGYVAGQQMNQQDESQGMQKLQGILAMQAQVEQQQQNRMLHPLQLEQLQTSIAQARSEQAAVDQFRAARGGAGGGTPASLGVGGMSTPGGGQANAITGQTIAPGAGILGGQGNRMPADVSLGLTIPRLAPWAKEEAKNFAPTDRMREAVALGLQPGTPAYNAHIGDVATQSGIWRTDANGNRNLAPGYAPGRGEVQAAEEGVKMNDFTIGGRPYKMTNADYQALTGPDPMKSMQVAERYQIPWSRNAGQAAPGAAPQPAAVPGPAIPTAVAPSAPLGAPIPSARVLGGATAAEKAGSERGAHNDADLVNTYRQKIPTLNSTLKRLDRVEALASNDNTYAAAGAELKTQLGSLAQSMGLEVNKSKTANSEEYLAHIAELLKDRLASKDYGSGTGISNLDLIAAKGPLPDLARTAQGRQQIIGAVRADAQRSLRDATAAREFFDQNSSLRGFRYPSEIQGQIETTRPGAPNAAPRGKVIKWSDL